MIVRQRLAHKKQLYIVDVFEEDRSIVPYMNAVGCWEPDIQKAIYATMKNNGYVSFLDIGANFGQHSLALAVAMPETKITCIEAAEETCKKIKSSCVLNKLTNIDVINAVLSNEESEINYYFDKSKSAISFVADTDYGRKNCPGELKFVKSQILKNIVKPNYDFIKIDIEGSEKFVIESSPEIFNAAQVCSIEINNHCSREFFGYEASDNLKLLKDLGFTTFYYLDKHGWLAEDFDAIIDVCNKNVMIETICTKE